MVPEVSIWIVQPNSFNFWVKTLNSTSRVHPSQNNCLDLMLFCYFFHIHQRMDFWVPTFLDITPLAPYITTCQQAKYAALPVVITLSLNSIKCSITGSILPCSNNIFVLLLVSFTFFYCYLFLVCYKCIFRV